MTTIESTIIDFLVNNGISEDGFFSYEVVPTFTDGIEMIIWGEDEDEDITFIPLCLEYNKYDDQLDIVYVNVGNEDEFCQKAFSAHTQEEQNKMLEMVHFIMETM